MVGGEIFFEVFLLEGEDFKEVGLGLGGCVLDFVHGIILDVLYYFNHNYFGVDISR